MNRSLKLLCVLGAVVVVSVTLVQGEPTYIGASKCKLCHKVSYESWSSLKHAKAFEVLKPDEQSNPQCLECHATGGTAEFPGVQCEACHGPGSEYKSMKIMKDHEASLAAGLVVPDKQVCEGCHVGDAPHEMPEFNYEEAKAKGTHEFKKRD